MSLNPSDLTDLFGPIIGSILAGILLFSMIVKTTKNTSSKPSNSDLQLWIITQVRDPILRRLDDLEK